MHLRTSHKCNRKKKTCSQTLPFVRIIKIIGIVNSKLVHGVRFVGALHLPVEPVPSCELLNGTMDTDCWQF